MPATKAKERAAEPQAPSKSLYDVDFYSWTTEQAAALREGRTAALDRENLAEEIEDLGKALFSELRSHLRVILTHMLKWDAQPERRSRSWAASIETHRIDVADILAENPSLKPRQEEALISAFRQARLRASVEMGRDKREISTICPYTVADALTREFPWPQD